MLKQLLISMISFVIVACGQSHKRQALDNVVADADSGDKSNMHEVNSGESNAGDHLVERDASNGDDVSDIGMKGPWDNIACADAPSISNKVYIRSADSISFGTMVPGSPGYANGIAELTLQGRTITIDFHQHGRCVVLGNYERVSWGGLDGENWIEPHRYFFVSDDGTTVTDNYTGEVWNL